MSSFVRIKDYLINLENVTYVWVEGNHIDFAFVSKRPDDQNFIRFEKGSHLQDAEFEQVKEFVEQLPDPDRVIII